MARGPVRSRKLSDIAAEIKDVADSGIKEAVLTGISVASYGRDLNGETLTDAIRTAANVPGIERVRLSSIGPGAVTPDLLKAFADLPQLCGHVHLSLQSGCDKTLADMNRKYSADEYADAVHSIRSVRPDAAITTDVIVGFPGETDGDFDDSYAFVERMGFAALHVFPFSRREGTAAAVMPGQLPRSVRESRAARMIELGQVLKSGFIDQNIGAVVPVLFESRLDTGEYAGLTPNYIEVAAGSEADIRGLILPVRLTSREGERAAGTLVTRM